jgi:hypothetical protein
MNTTNISAPNGMSERFDAFVSYDRSDNADVTFIMQQLEIRGGISYFIDAQLGPGDNWIQRLTEKLALAETFLFFIRAVPSTWQMHELNAAITMLTSDPDGKPSIIPVLLPDSPAEAFLGNRKIAFLHHMMAAQFRIQANELDVIDSLARAVSDRSRVWISSRAFRRPDDLPPSFQADLGGLTDLLIGESVYKSEDICVRELIQNARDACSRVVTNLTPGYRLPETILVVDEQNRYFDVIDFGDGMSKHALTESFSLLGKSLNPDIERFRRTKQSLENPVTGKFGIGFVSVFMIADRVVVSTKSLSESCYHFTISRASLPFTFHMEESRCGRDYPDNGTTVRVYLRPEFATGPKLLKIKEIAEGYCRHVPLFFIQDGLKKRAVESDWNVDPTSPIVASMKTDQYEVHLSWATDKIQGIVLSNGGFLVRRLEDTVLGGVPNAFISGEINVAPGFVDLNIARDNVVDNEKLNALRTVLGDCLSELFEKSSAFVENVELSSPMAMRQMAAYVKKNATIAKSVITADRKIGLLPIRRFLNFHSLYVHALASYLASRVVEERGGDMALLRKRLLSGDLKIVYANSFSNDWKKQFPEERIQNGLIGFVTSDFVVQINGRQEAIGEADILAKFPSDIKVRALTEEEACSRFYGWLTWVGFRKRAPEGFGIVAVVLIFLYGLVALLKLLYDAL